ncbi:hypothetical protein QUF64_05255 [Anaerolineales bacterium HSG6]|nr:hypothetical protein [Anaerolineales bacterium HSG6]
MESLSFVKVVTFVVSLILLSMTGWQMLQRRVIWSEAGWLNFVRYIKI